MVGPATVVGTVFTVAAFWVGQKDPPTKPNPAAAGDRRVVFADVVTLTAATGFDLDGGAAVKFETRETAVDLFLGDYDELTSSTRNSGLINDSYRGDEPGAYERCRTYRRTGRATLAKDRMLTDYQQQYCFTTSDGRPAWLRTAGASSDGGVIVKAVVWAS